jgi:diamine N-acetyltransferase
MLKGKQIYLRGVEIEDLNYIEEIENNPENWLISGTLIPFSRKSLEEYILSIRSLAIDKQSRWIICKNDTHSQIGAIDLFEYDAIHRRAGMGIIIDEDYRKNGLASEAISILKEYAFSFLNLSQLWANILEDNKASQALFEKLGFIKSATKKKWFIKDGAWYDEHFYQLENGKQELI